jgi:hypothetical protein
MSVSDHLAILRNPFSLALPTGKVPDGKVNLSTAERLQTSFQQNFNSGEMTILLSPSFSTPYVYRVKTSLPGVIPPTYLETAIGYRDAGHQMVYDHANHTMTKAAAAPDKWRLVSAGLRLSLVNTSERNDGWFEAIRVNTSYSPQDFRVTDPQNPAVDFNVYQSIDKMEGGILMSTNSWANDPSYTTGKLVDIHKWMFYLQASEERDFKSLPTQWDDDLGDVDGGLHMWECLNSSVTPGFMVDKTFDCVAIRLFSSSSGNVGTSMLVHSVHNFEGVYDPSSTLCKFQSSTPNAPDMVLKSDRFMRRDIRPAIFRG